MSESTAPGSASAPPPELVFAIPGRACGAAKSSALAHTATLASFAAAIAPQWLGEKAIQKQGNQASPAVAAEA
jgi:hypothetical protein